MTDLDLLVAGALVSFLSVAGAYVAMRRRANETPVSAYRPQQTLAAYTSRDADYPVPAPVTQNVDVR